MVRVNRLVGGLLAAPLILGVLGVAVPLAAQAKQTIINGEVLRQDTTWTKSGAPYVIREAVQIPHGVTLTVEPGTKIVGDGTDYLFRVGGNLDIAGSSRKPVTIEAGRRGSVISHATTHTKPGSITISHARITNTRSIMPPGGNGMYVTFVLADSTVRGVPRSSEVWYPLAGSAIVRNTFTRSGGFSIGHNARGENGVPGPSPIRVEGNRFLTRSTTGYWIESWAAYGAPLPVHGNSFATGGRVALRLPEGYDSSAIDARGNYWGTTKSRVIDRMILDALDDITRADTIEYRPTLRKAPSLPLASTPGAPQEVTVEATSESAVQVRWEAPADLGGSSPVTYRVTASPGPGSCEVTEARRCTVDDLPGGEHTFTVTASNAAGTSDPSAVSASVLVDGGDPDPGPDPGPDPTPSPDPSGALASITLGRISMETQGRWVAPDGCGNYLFRFSGVLPEDIGTFALINADTGESLDSDLTFGGLAAGVETFTVCDYQDVDGARLALSVDFFGLGVARSGTFTWESQPEPLPSPSAPPISVSAGSISVQTSGPWPRPASSGCTDYLFSYSGITTDDIGTIRLIDATTRSVLDSEIYLGSVGNGLDSFLVCSYQVTSGTRPVLQLDFSGLSVVESRNFRWQSAADPAPAARPLPATASVGGASASTSGSWSLPSSCTQYRYTYSGLPADAVATVRVVNAVTRKSLGSDYLISPGSSGGGTVLICRTDVTSSTIAQLQLEVSGLGLAVSGAFRFG